MTYPDPANTSRASAGGSAYAGRMTGPDPNLATAETAPVGASIAEADITGLAHGGDGVCRLEGRVCFVPYALPGDRVRIALGAATKGILRGRIVEVLSPSPHRAQAGCGVFGRCGGCTWLHFAYPAQLEWKARIVSDCLERIGKISAQVQTIEDPALRLGYRTRATFRSDGQRWGFYEAGTHDLVDIASCPLCHPKLNAALGALRTLEVTGPVEVVVNPSGAEVMVYTATEQPALRETFPAYNTRDDGERVAFWHEGAPIVNGSFSQSSLLLNRLLVEKVHALAAGASRVLDLYCGNGNLSRGLADAVEVHGMDSSPHGIAAAQLNTKAHYARGDERGFAQLIGEGPWDAIIVDPPRTGAKAIANALAGAKAGQIVYVSCDPATFARDAAVLVAGGWSLSECTVIDLFPNTFHIETVGLFQCV